MRKIRWVILLLLAGATAVLLGTAVYTYRTTTHAQSSAYSPTNETLPSGSAINLIMEEGGLALIAAAHTHLLAYDRRRADFSLGVVRFNRASNPSPYLLPSYEPLLKNDATDLPGPVKIDSINRQVSHIEAKASAPCTPSTMNRRLLWARPWPTTTNPVTTCLCPETAAPPLLASAP